MSVQTRFNYAWGSVKSNNKVEVGEGITLLMGKSTSLLRVCVHFLLLTVRSPQTSTVPSQRAGASVSTSSLWVTTNSQTTKRRSGITVSHSPPARVRGTPLALADVCHSLARRALAGLLLEKEPHNIQAQSLAGLVESAVAKEGYVGLALAGGAATVAGLIITALMSSSRGGRR